MRYCCHKATEKEAEEHKLPAQKQATARHELDIAAAYTVTFCYEIHDIERKTDRK